jgi:hypothetical protein
VKWWTAVLIGLGAGVALASPVGAGAEPPGPLPGQEFVSDPTALIQIPAGCPPVDPADVAFVGTVLAKDEFVEKGTVRWQIDQVRAGNAAPFSVDGVVDVRFGPDSQYLDIDEQYLVSAAFDPSIGTLTSKASPDAPLFGGDAVVGLEDTETVCPVVDDPVQTINVDGTAVETGLFEPLTQDKRLLLATIAVPAAIVGLALIGLILLRRLIDIGFRGIFALGRAAVVPSGDHRAARVRRHARGGEIPDVPDPDDVDEVADGDPGAPVDEPSDADDSDLVDA